MMWVTWWAVLVVVVELGGGRGGEGGGGERRLALGLAFYIVDCVGGLDGRVKKNDEINLLFPLIRT